MRVVVSAKYEGGFYLPGNPAHPIRIMSDRSVCDDFLGADVHWERLSRRAFRLARKYAKINARLGKE